MLSATICVPQQVEASVINRFTNCRLLDPSNANVKYVIINDYLKNYTYGAKVEVS